MERYQIIGINQINKRYVAIKTKISGSSRELISSSSKQFRTKGEMIDYLSEFIISYNF
jgi:hypothetical protein